MRFGCCCSVEQAATVHAAGFDYIETTVVSLQPEADDAAFAPILAQYQAAPLPVLACNVFLPGDLKVVGPEVDWPRVERYVRSALQRVRLIGAELVVFGSGRSRMLPDGWARADAQGQLVDFLQLVGAVAATYALTIAIEPLNRKESNILTSVAEAVALAERVNRPSIRVLADFYHMDEEREPLHALTDYAAWLAHIHVADTERRAPGLGVYPYAEFVTRLQQAKYNGLVSIECRWGNFAAETRSAYEFLQQVFA